MSEDILEGFLRRVLKGQRDDKGAEKGQEVPYLRVDQQSVPPNFGIKSSDLYKFLQQVIVRLDFIGGQIETGCLNGEIEVFRKDLQENDGLYRPHTYTLD